VITTTLDLMAVLPLTTRSDRKIAWIKLTPLDADQLFRNISFLPFKCIIRDCTGRGRSLEAFNDYLTKNPDTRPNLPLLRELLKNQIDEPFIPTVQQLKAPILASEVSLTMRPDDDIHDYAYYVRTGAYLNSLDVQTFIPQLSLWSLYNFSHPEKTSSLNGVTKKANILLNELFSLEPNFNWELFERFHPIVESLRRIFNPSVVTLSTEYPMAMCNPSFRPTYSYNAEVDHKFYLPTFLQHQHPSNKPIIGKNETEPLTEPSEALNRFFIPAYGNPGFDSFIIQKLAPPSSTKKQKGETKYLAICFENRWSADEAKTTLNLKVIKEKYNIVSKNYQAIGKQAGIACDDFCLIIVAWRGLTKDVMPTDLPHNTLILDRDALQKFYGPTLTVFQQFYRDQLPDA